MRVNVKVSMTSQASETHAPITAARSVLVQEQTTSVTAQYFVVMAGARQGS
jgi:hypothetical protein